MRNHTLKCWPRFFEDIVSGCKTVELRKNDRNFDVGEPGVVALSIKAVSE